MRALQSVTVWISVVMAACGQEPTQVPPRSTAVTPQATTSSGTPATASPTDAPTAAPKASPTQFARFVTVGDGGHLDTAITTYRKGDVELVLYAAVHIADKALYDELNDRFTTRDALLYELVGPADHRPSRNAKARDDSPLGLMQKGLKNSLELSFQLDEIDYTPDNFVHADMTPAEFAASMDERGESIVSIMFSTMMGGMRAQAAAGDGDGPPAKPVDLVAAFRSGEGRHTLRMTFAQQMQQIEAMAAGGEGGTLLEGRNEKCLTVLQRELAAGRKRLGIYYGAAHLPHMERRLVGDLGFTKTGQEWLVAWDCAKRPDPKYDRALVKQRQQAKRELGGLAAAARKARLASDPETALTMDLLVWHHQDLAEAPRRDPWGHDYVVRKRKTGVRWEVVSAGQDGVVDTADDLVAVEPRGGGL